ncbi:MAG TPA: dihydrofolate reductase family protein [Pseudolysinimonas sp.]|nr:dihydrofolate reductase family protein [Pseudolysinimonas sp.]
MIVRAVWPQPGRPIDTAAPDARQRLRELYAVPTGTDWLRVNLVVGLDGSARGADGTSHSLSGGADRAVLGAIRSLADTVLVGGATLRAEPGLIPKTAALAVLSRSGDLGDAVLRPGDRVLPRLEPIPGSVVCEGGPSVVRALLDAGLVDEVCLSTAPLLTGTDFPAFGGAGAAEWELTQLLVDDAGYQFARFRVPSQSRIAPSQRSRS